MDNSFDLDTSDWSQDLTMSHRQETRLDSACAALKVLSSACSCPAHVRLFPISRSDPLIRSICQFICVIRLNGSLECYSVGLLCSYQGLGFDFILFPQRGLARLQAAVPYAPNCVGGLMYNAQTNE